MWTSSSQAMGATLLRFIVNVTFEFIKAPRLFLIGLASTSGVVCLRTEWSMSGDKDGTTVALEYRRRPLGLLVAMIDLCLQGSCGYLSSSRTGYLMLSLFGTATSDRKTTWTRGILRYVGTSCGTIEIMEQSKQMSVRSLACALRGCCRALGNDSICAVTRAHAQGDVVTGSSLL